MSIGKVKRMEKQLYSEMKIFRLIEYLSWHGSIDQERQILPSR